METMFTASSLYLFATTQNVEHETIGVRMTRFLRLRKRKQKRFPFNSWGGVRLDPLGTSATSGPIVPAPDDDDDDCAATDGMMIVRGNRSTWKKTYPKATLSTTNATQTDLVLKSGRRGGKPATNRLNYGTAKTNVSAVSLRPPAVRV
jgi:hypothetical protein